jgi:hypothetical protein
LVDVHPHHEPTKIGMNALGFPPPFLVRMARHEDLAQVDNATELIAQPIEILYDELEFPLATRGREVQPTKEKLGMEDARVGERAEGRGRDEVGLGEEAR